MRKIYCDMCGKEIRITNKIEIYVDCKNQGHEEKWAHEFDDVCDDCMNEMREAQSQKYKEICMRNKITPYKIIRV